MLVDALADVLVEFQRIVAFAVRHAFDAGHQPHAAHFADQRQVLQRPELRLEIGRDMPRVRQHLVFENVEVLQRHRAADRVAGVGQPVAEQGVRMVGAAQVLQQSLGNHDAAEREIAGGDALGEDDHVRVEVEQVAGGEDGPEPPEGGDHFVGNIEDLVLPADLADAPEITVRRHDDAARGLDRFADESADLFRADPLDSLPEFLDQEIGEAFFRDAFRAVERVRRGELDHQFVGAVHPVAVARAAVERGRQVGRAMIGTAAAEDQLLLRAAADIVIELHETQRRLHRGRASGGVEDVGEVARRVAGNAPRQFRRGRVHRVPGGVVGKLQRLLVHDSREFLAAMADIDAPHAGRAVDQLLAASVGDVDAVAFADQRARLGADRAGVRPGLDEMARRQIDGVLRITAFHWFRFAHRRHVRLRAALPDEGSSCSKRRLSSLHFECPFNQYCRNTA